jgi:molybdopterin-guanine dinucleotide biosynthesis protein A
LVVFEAGAIILAGVKSSRMGSPKASLQWHGSTLPRLVTGLAQRTVDGPVVVVRAPGQELPAVYRTSLLPEVDALIAADNLRPAFLFERCRVLRLDDAATRLWPLWTRAQRVAAWTLGQLADAIALTLDEHAVAALNGDQITRDRELPLAAGDTVGFMVADAGG